jgi:hypothetical protein
LHSESDYLLTESFLAQKVRNNFFVFSVTFHCTIDDNISISNTGITRVVANVDFFNFAKYKISTKKFNFAKIRRNFVLKLSRNLVELFVVKNSINCDELHLNTVSFHNYTIFNI